ncbi:alpha-1,2-fucosyltransferase [Arenimonas sp.]|nr:alpha-1,2-fucosyltransferase [Candidatus Parcubacteria bacterium]
MTKIITIKGGLGNQLFQYAHGLKVFQVDKKEVIYDISFFQSTGKDIHRPFLLDKFNIDPAANLKKIHRNLLIKIYIKIWQKITGDYQYFQSEKYFIEVKDEVLKQFTLKNPMSQNAQEVARNINTNSVSLHIRRGDYVNSTHHNLCDLEYYYKALHHIKSQITNPHFFIFSDDIEWAKNNMQVGEATFVSNSNIPEVEEMILMSLCTHNIISNSTFSWWSAYLNQNPHKIVVAPKQWTNTSTSDKLEILPKTWIQL